MSVTVCVLANTFGYPQGSGHRWVYLNWALGLCELGCQVVWLEGVAPSMPAHEVRANLGALRNHLGPYGLADHIALYRTGEPLPPEVPDVTEGVLNLETAADADLLLNMQYGTPPEVVERFRKSALIDIDPGLLQVWMSKGWIQVAQHDLYFSTGETVGRPGTRFPDAGLRWQYAPPCVSLEWWPPHRASEDAPFTTVSHWYTSDEWMEDEHGVYANDKRDGFLPFLDLPQYTSQSLELALCLGAEEEEERAALQGRGWRVRHSYTVTDTPWAYQRYIQNSRGELSCVKPSCVRLQNAWISDRSLCYLASGKPVLLQHTGPSRFLPDSAGLFRFRDIDEAARYLETVAADYDRQCSQARALAEEHFDARKVAGHVLERALA